MKRFFFIDIVHNEQEKTYRPMVSERVRSMPGEMDATTWVLLKVHLPSYRSPEEAYRSTDEKIRKMFLNDEVEISDRKKP